MKVLRGTWIAIGWLGVGLLLYLSLTPKPIDISIDHGDKIGHLFAYAFLTIWWMQLHSDVKQQYLLALILINLGIAIEYIQCWTGWRTFDYFDMLANCTGVIIGWLASKRIPNCLDLFKPSRNEHKKIIQK